MPACCRSRRTCDDRRAARHRSRPSGAATLLLSALLWCSPALAQPSAEHQRGRDALAAGRPAEAVTLLRAAWAHDRHPAILLDLAIAHERLGQPHQAVELYAYYLRKAGPRAVNAAAVRARVRRIRSECAVLVLQLEPASARLFVDDLLARPIAGFVLATPGQHTLRIEAPGYETVRQTLELPAGRLALGLALVPASGGAREVATAPDTTRPGAPAAGGEPSTGLRVGPVATFGVLAPLGIGLLARASEYVAFGLDVQYLPPVGNSEISLTTVNLFLRVHPVASALFFSGGFGFYDIDAIDADRGTKVQGSMTFPGLDIGFGLTLLDDLVLGFDLMLMIPLASPSIDVEIVEGSPSPTEAELLTEGVRTTMNDVKSFLPVIPQLNLLRIGYLF